MIRIAAASPRPLGGTRLCGLSRLRLVLYALLLGLGLTTGPTQAAVSGTIVLIGGKKSHGPFEHDPKSAFDLIERLLRTSPDLPAGMTVRAYPDGWPSDPAALADASTIVWYFDGLRSHPLRDAAAHAGFAAAMKRGVGLVALHQASTLPRGEPDPGLLGWLGAVREGMVDRTTQTVAFTPAAHPIASGVQPFAYRDEFYPTVRFSPRGVTPILRGILNPTSDAAPAPGPAVERTIGWAYDRPGGGRAFGFTGLHYLDALEHEQPRRLLLNAIFWTAGLRVPDKGVRAGAQPGDAGIVSTPAAKTLVVPQNWGKLTWFASGELGNSATMTVGQAVITPGKHNPRHLHPNCDEVLRVVSGRIRHTMGNQVAEMGPGDVVSIPQGVTHNATNIGSADAVLEISFNSAYRRTIGY